MPVSLDDMMKGVSSDQRAQIERDASSLADDYRRRAGQSASAFRDPSLSTQIAVGAKARTGQRCPESGIWSVEHMTTATMPIAIHNLMPPYQNQPVTWVLVQHA